MAKGGRMNSQIEQARTTAQKEYDSQLPEETEQEETLEEKLNKLRHLKQFHNLIDETATCYKKQIEYIYADWQRAYGAYNEAGSLTEDQCEEKLRLRIKYARAHNKLINMIKDFLNGIDEESEEHLKNYLEVL